jgi:predicted nucleic acid-binding protein
MIVVSDTTPLNILAQLDLTELLVQLFGAVIIPPAVADFHRCICRA